MFTDNMQLKVSSKSNDGNRYSNEPTWITLILITLIVVVLKLRRCHTGPIFSCKLARHTTFLARKRAVVSH